MRDEREEEIVDAYSGKGKFQMTLWFPPPSLFPPASYGHLYKGKGGGVGDILLAPRCCGGGGGTAAQKMKVGLVGERGRMGGEGGPKTLPVLGRRR